MSRGQRGFTLLEIVVVLLVFSVMSVMAYGALDNVLTSQARIEASLERTAEYQRTYRRLRDDLRQVRYRAIRDGFGDLQPPLLHAGDSSFVFTRGGWRNPLLAPRASLERVRYRMTGGTLFRDSWRVLDQAQDSPVIELPLLTGVELLRWRFLDADREWQDDWSPDRGGLPLMIELTVETRDWGRLRWLFRPGVDLAAVPVLSRFESAGGAPAPGTEPPPAPSTDPEASE